MSLWGRLAMMMGLVYATQGGWWPVFTVHLEEIGLDGRQRGLIFSTMSVAMLVASLGVGRLVDRVLATERYMCLAYAVGATLLTIVALDLTRNAVLLYLIFLVYFCFVAPTHGLANSLALRNLDRPQELFSSVRLWGTIGWMVAGWLTSGMMRLTTEFGFDDSVGLAFGLGVICATGLAIFSRFLPHTPPLDRRGPVEAAPEGAREPAARFRFEAIAEILSDRPTRVFLIMATITGLTIPNMFQVIPLYLKKSGLHPDWVASVMTLGQMTEIVSVAITPWLIRRFGYKAMLALGVTCWALRFGSLAMGPPLWLAVAGTLLHGPAVAYLMIGGPMLVDQRAPRQRRGTAQGLVIVTVGGIGTLVGNLMAGEIVQFADGDYGLVFLIPCLIDLLALTYLIVAMRGLDRPPAHRVSEPMIVATPSPSSRPHSDPEASDRPVDHPEPLRTITDDGRTGQADPPSHTAATSLESSRTS